MQDVLLVVMKKCNACGVKFDLAKRFEREKNMLPEDRSRHDYCASCQDTGVADA